MKKVVLLLLVLVSLAGCGVEWFPEVKRDPTTPDPFSFASRTGVQLSTLVVSDPITISGLTAAAPVSVTGSSGSDSKYSINDGTPTNAAGTVKNGDKVTVQHTSSGNRLTDTATTLTIGTVSATFTSKTGDITALAPVTKAAGTVAESTSVIITTVLGNTNHTVTITPPGSAYSVGGAAFSTATNVSIPIANGASLLLRNTVPTTVGQSTTTVFTIDGTIQYTFTSTAQ